MSQGFCLSVKGFSGILKEIPAFCQGPAPDGGKASHIDPFPGQTAVLFGIAEHVIDGHGFIVSRFMLCLKRILRPGNLSGGAADAVRAVQKSKEETVCILLQSESADHGFLIVLQKDGCHIVFHFFII